MKILFRNIDPITVPSDAASAILGPLSLEQPKLDAEFTATVLNVSQISIVCLRLHLNQPSTLRYAESLHVLVMTHQQQFEFPSGTPGCSRWLQQLLPNNVPSDGSLQAYRHIANIPPLHCAQNVVTYTLHQNNICVTLFPGAAVMLQLFTQCLAMFMSCSS
jgi:hypothetical protein